MISTDWNPLPSWLWTANITPSLRFDMLKYRMRRGIHIAVALLVIVVLIGPSDCFANGAKAHEAAACCLKGECHPGANADDCCKNMPPDGARLMAATAMNHHVPLVVSPVAESCTLVSPPVFERLTNELRHPSPQPSLATVNLPLLI